MLKMHQMKRILLSKKIFFSVFILFHLLCIVIFPNPYSVLARSFSSYINPYGNLFGFNTTWQFFSPDPGMLRYIDYQVVEEKDENIQIHDYRWPPLTSFFSENRARKFYYGLRTALSEEKRKDFFVSFLCRLHPEATSIVIKTVSESIPSMEKMRVSSAKGFSDAVETIGIPMQEFGCERGS